jgi:hypothetical protein
MREQTQEELRYWRTEVELWQDDIKAIVSLIKAKGLKRITRREIDDAIDPKAVRRKKCKKNSSGYVPSKDGEYHSDDMYCVLINGGLLDTSSYSSIVLYGRSTEEWGIHANCKWLKENESVVNEQINEELVRRVRQLEERLSWVERVLFVEVSKPESAKTTSSPWGI